MSLSRNKGFTILEMLMVVAILAIGSSMVFSTINRRKSILEVDQAARDLRDRIAEARGLAAIAGSRIGTGDLVNGCDALNPTNQIRIRIDPQSNQYMVPENLRYDSTLDVWQVDCTTYSLSSLTNGHAVIRYPTSRLDFAFTATGRAVSLTPGSSLAQLYLQIDHATDPIRYGFRVLPSGVICHADDPAAITCIEDP